MPQEPFIFKAVRQQLLWPSIHAAVEVYQRRRASAADHYELIWRLIHICECTVITLASAAISRLREMGRSQEFLKLRERSYGITWNSTEESLEKGNGALDGSIDKWIEILQFIPTLNVEGSSFLEALQKFLLGAPSDPSAECNEHCVDLGPLVRAWSRASDVPPSVTPDRVSVKDAFQAINSFRNRFAHVPFPYDQVQEIYRELEACTFQVFAVPPSAANDGSPLSGYFALRDSLLRGPGYMIAPEAFHSVPSETFVWGKKEELKEVWDARPFVYLDKMMRPYLLTRLKNEAGSWEYTRYLAEANAVISISSPDLLRLLPRPEETEYVKDDHPQDAVVAQPIEPSPVGPLRTKEEAFEAIRRRNFEPAIEFWREAVEDRPYYHSGWQRLGFAQREWGVDLMDSDREAAERLFRDSIVSFGHATNHSDPQYGAEAYYNRSKAHWRLWRLTDDPNEFKNALNDAQKASRSVYDGRFESWNEFLKENVPSGLVMAAKA